EAVQVADEIVHASVERIFEMMPVERMVMRPLPLLSEFAAHKQQLLAGMRPHEGVVAAQICKFLPTVTRHAAKERSFAMHDFVVAEGQNEVLAEGIDQPECHLVVVVTPVDRILADIGQGVVHPAHVPLEAEAESSGMDWPRDS